MTALVTSWSAMVDEWLIHWIGLWRWMVKDREILWMPEARTCFLRLTIHHWIHGISIKQRKVSRPSFQQGQKAEMLVVISRPCLVLMPMDRLRQEHTILCSPQPERGIIIPQQCPTDASPSESIIALLCCETTNHKPPKLQRYVLRNALPQCSLHRFR